MSLDFDLSGTALPVNDEGVMQWTTATEYLIFATMSTGIGDLSEKNAPEFFARLQALYDLDRVAPENRVNAADVKQHIGLKTNASYVVETRARWLKRAVGRDLDRTASTFAADALKATPRPLRLS